VSCVRIATRGSDLALAQASYVAGRIRDELGCETELVILKTTGDRVQNVSLAKIGGKGLFVKEIEEALMEGSADVAIHSAKDLPAELAAGLRLIAYPQREDPRDALVCRQPGERFSALRHGARVGTGSARRKAQLLAARPDLDVVPLRGNVPTRLGKLESEDLDAVVLAAAGLERLSLAGRISERMSPETMLPAVCQGVLALEIREGDDEAEGLRALDDEQVAIVAVAERSFLQRLGGDCTVPIAAHAQLVSGGRVRLDALVASVDGRRLARASDESPIGEATALGSRVAERILAQGGAAILEQVRAASRA
jgi:hydroxymethylbilane synthase